MPDPRRILRELGVFPSKSRSQNFLSDNNIIERFLDEAAVLDGEIVVEVGPGTGSITSPLLVEHDGAYIGVEIDRVLCEALERTIRGETRVRFICGDILKTTLDELMADAPGIPCSGTEKAVVLASLPYSITGRFLRWLMNNRDRLSRAVLIIQKDVAERITASPGSSARGMLTVMADYHFLIENRCEVSPRSFYPVPEVTSSIVRLSPRVEQVLPDGFNLERFEKVVSAAFLGRRKMIKNALGNAGFTSFPENVDSSRRPQTFSTEEFIDLSISVDFTRPKNRARKKTD